MRFVVVCALVLAGCSESSTSPVAPAGGAPFVSGLNAFDLSGLVRDSVLRPVGGATVEISEGPLAGRFTTTDGAGRFAFVGLTPRLDSVYLRVTKPGYSPAVVTLRNHLDSVVTLTSVDLPSLLGDYRFAFTAAHSCSQLPAWLRTRTYRATIRPAVSQPAGIIIALGGADVLPGYATFSGTLAADAARLSIFSRDAFNWWLEDLPIIERLGPTSYLAFMGVSTAAVGRPGAPLTAPVDGTVSYCPAAAAPRSPDFPPSCTVAALECRSSEHHIALTPW